MAKIPAEIMIELKKQYPKVPEALAESGALSAANIYSVEQVVGLAVSELLDREGGFEGPGKVRQMIPDRTEADRLIEEHYRESGPGYGVGYGHDH